MYGPHFNLLILSSPQSNVLPVWPLCLINEICSAYSEEPNHIPGSAINFKVVCSTRTAAARVANHELSPADFMTYGGSCYRQEHTDA